MVTADADQPAFEFECHRCGAPCSEAFTEMVDDDNEFAVCAACAKAVGP